jgi:hypothetical protein
VIRFRVRMSVAIVATTVVLFFPPTLSRPGQFSSPRSSALSQHNVAHAAPLSTNSSNSIYFRETGHYLKDAFLNYWLMNGGVRLYGFPVTEEFTHEGTTVQYFERSRFEFNPNSSRPWKVELTIFPRPSKQAPHPTVSTSSKRVTRLAGRSGSSGGRAVGLRFSATRSPRRSARAALRRSISSAHASSLRDKGACS